ncbi:class I SAM-dependent methyltransferase [Streptomyces sp. NPDC001787]|uniref:class I SAM-dependent methyltransferase n=1 Tax=Streptomyces sp. NPDC001787 TaxID=3154523 RepID=UPI00332F61F3
MTPLRDGAAARASREARLAGRFDALHDARSRTTIAARLYAEAHGEEYPGQVAASGSCDWTLLSLLVARLRLRPRQVLVDAGCGTGGVGLWLARALDSDLIGVDLSPVAVREAVSRRAGFGLAPDRAAFRTASLEATGLPSVHAHGIVCVDALGFAADPAAALHELARILAPGARLALTRSTRSGTGNAWAHEAAAAGLTLEHIDERPDEPAMWNRLYGLWIDHAAELRHELGQEQAASMLAEAGRRRPTLPGRRAVLLTLRRPPAPPGAGAPTDTMTAQAPGADAGPESPKSNTQ